MSIVKPDPTYPPQSRLRGIRFLLKEKWTKKNILKEMDDIAKIASNVNSQA